MYLPYHYYVNVCHCGPIEEQIVKCSGVTDRLLDNNISSMSNGQEINLIRTKIWALTLVNLAVPLLDLRWTEAFQVEAHLIRLPH